jgi:multisubunit Na+/H+ antiporter MnhB subunit
MKNLLKKYVGIIIGILVSFLFLLGYHYYPTNPKLANIFINIVAWYISLVIGLAITLISLKIFLWGIRKINKQKSNNETQL